MRARNTGSLSDQAFKRRSTLRIRLLFLSCLLAAMATPSLGQAPSAAPQSAPSSTPADSAATPTKPPDPAPLPMPSMAGPLQTAVPHEVEGGKLAVTGILTGIGWSEGN